MTQAQELSPEEYFRQRPKQISGAGMIIRDDAGRALLEQTCYGAKLWEIPGGGVDQGEYPAQTARREVKEELGLDAEPGQLLVVDWVPWTPPIPDAKPTFLANYVFAGPVLTPAEIATIRCDNFEIANIRFCNPSECEVLLPSHMGRRVDDCMEVLRTGKAVYIEHGYRPEV
jgi:8-oxo-dGTP pyrophosphatase MutT (NUDIX family)